jgi:hypothetical protein
LEKVRNHFRFRLRAEVAFAVQAYRDIAGVQVATADDEPGVDAQLFRVLNLRLDGIAAEVGAHANHLPAQFVGDVLRVSHQRGGRGIVFRADGEDADLFGREPEREVAGVMLNQKAGESFVARQMALVNLNSISLDIRPDSFYLSSGMKRAGTVFNKEFAGR